MSLSGIAVLAVDDDPDARELVSVILSRAGATVAPAASMGEALGYLARGHRPQVLITDLRMPGGDGFSLIVQMRQHYADIPVLVFTAYYDEPGWATRLSELGARLIPKQVHPDVLVRAVETIVSH
jgi:CheY-like chemotaxis protein